MRLRVDKARIDKFDLVEALHAFNAIREQFFALKFRGQPIIRGDKVAATSFAP